MNLSPASSSTSCLLFWNSWQPYSCPVVITGDLNLHIDFVGACNARRFQELMDTFGLQQSVTAPTHRDGHILDVVVTRSDLPHPVVEVRPWGKLSPDHSLVLFQLPLPRPLKFINFSTRAWRNFNPDKFRTDLPASRLCVPLVDPDGVSANWLQDTYRTGPRCSTDTRPPELFADVIRQRHRGSMPTAPLPINARGCLSTATVAHVLQLIDVTGSTRYDVNT